MSNGDKKRNVGDIQSLRERLGMLKKGASVDGKPTVPGATYPAQDQSEAEAEITRDEYPPEVDSTVNSPPEVDEAGHEQVRDNADWSSVEEPTEAQGLDSIVDNGEAPASEPDRERFEVAAPESEAMSAGYADAEPGPLDDEAFNPLSAGQAPAPAAQRPLASPPQSLSMPKAPEEPAAPMGRSSFDVFAQASPLQARTTATAGGRPSQSARGPSPSSSGAESVGEEPVRGNAAFANPVQVGRYTQAQPTVDLSADEQEALQTFEASEKGIKLSLAAFMTLGVALVTLVFGFLIGDIRNARRMINIQIDANVRLADNMKVPLTELDALKRIVLSTDHASVDWDKIQAIPKDLAQLDAGTLLSSPVPLSRDLTRQLSNILVDMELLFSAARSHRNITLVRDRSELENIEKGTEFTRLTHFAVVYQPNPPKTKKLNYIPPKGRIVAVVGQPKLSENKKDRLLPVKTRGGERSEVSLSQVLVIDKKEFVESEQTNALSAYRKRVQSLKEQVQKIEQYETLFRQKLQEEAERQKVFSI